VTWKEGGREEGRQKRREKERGEERVWGKERERGKKTREEAGR
jgi:hypothetical protein